MSPHLVGIDRAAAAQHAAVGTAVVLPAHQRRGLSRFHRRPAEDHGGAARKRLCSLSPTVRQRERGAVAAYVRGLGLRPGEAGISSGPVAAAVGGTPSSTSGALAAFCGSVGAAASSGRLSGVKESLRFTVPYLLTQTFCSMQPQHEGERQYWRRRLTGCHCLFPSPCAASEPVGHPCSAAPPGR